MLLNCSKKVFIDKDSSFDFKAVSTYQWKPHKVALKHKEYDNDIITQNIQQMISDVLKSKGFNQSTISPDFTIDYVLEIQQKYKTETETYASPQNYMPPFGMGYYRGIGPTINHGRTTSVKAFFEGSIEILIFNSQNKLIWRGITFSDVKNPKIYTEQKLKEDIKKILKNHPF